MNIKYEIQASGILMTVKSEELIDCQVYVHYGIAIHIIRR